MKTLLCLSLLLGGLANGCAATNDSTSPKSTSANWTVRGNLPADKFVIQSHRGAGELAPENTLEAFELGWKLGTIPEADLRMTKDGVIVAFHDANFRRTTTNAPGEWLDKTIADLTYAELSQLDAGSWKGPQFRGLKIPRLSDVYATMRGWPERWLYLDIKNIDLQRLADEVRQHGVARQVIFTSTHYDMIRDWKKIVPESMTLNWMGGTQAALQKRLEVLRGANFEGITQLQLHVRLNTNSASVEPFNLTRKFIRDTGTELRAHNVILQTLPWGVAEPKIYWQLLDLGVMAFATDHPDITTKAVRDYYAGARP
jgi:glycerophosphoryl diester phosphodiesterase